MTKAMPDEETADQVRMRAATPADCPALAAIHCEALPDDLLPRLGVATLGLKFYPLLVASLRVSVVVIEQSGEVAGFIVVEQTPGAVMGVLLKRLAALLPSLAAALLRSPNLLASVACATLLKRVAKTGDDDLVVTHEIAFVAVAGAYRGGGLGSLLAMQANKTARAAGRRLLVKTASARAEAFYRGLGFKLVGSERRCSRRLSILLL